jgi:superfamily II DNA or RNA helicase
MVKTPDIKDDNFYKKINKIYEKFKVSKRKKTLEQICMPKHFEPQLPQRFLSEFITPNTQYKGILVYHRIGAGKTCSAIKIAEKWKKERRIIVVLPASLKGNFRNELRSLCANNEYMKDNERKEISTLNPKDRRYREIISTTDKRIDEYYEIYSYNKFIELIGSGLLNLRNAILIIDEIQNMVSEGGTYYEILYDAIQNAPKELRIVLLSATPMFDKPNEIALTMNLLRIPKEIPTGRAFDKNFIRTTERKNGTYSHNVKNMDKFKSLIKGYVSYFRGAPPHVFPKMTIKYVKCEMGEFQYNAYLRVLRNEDKNMDRDKFKNLMKSLNVSDLPNNFYIGTRVISNVVFPNQKINDDGFNSFTNKKIREDLYKYSTKFYEIMEKIERTSGKVFIYSSFKEFGGIKSFVRVLEAFGYSNYVESGVGKKRFAVWSGDEDISVKEEIRTVYNRKDNLKGGKLRILLGSPSIKEGVSLTAVRQVHVIEPYWNRSRLEQVIGRASRFCSHKDLEEEKRTVNVYIYVATAYGYNRKKEVEDTVDQYIEVLAKEKDKVIKEFEKAIKESAVDCYLNKNANVYEGEEDIKCNI